MAVNVYVWWPSKAGIGHSAMSVSGVYLSFWPGGSGISSEKDTAKFYPAHFMTTLDDDVRSERSRPHETVILNRLDENKMLDFVRAFKSLRRNYHLMLNNCSQPVKIALYEGSNRTPPNFAVVAPESIYGPVPSSVKPIESVIRASWNPDSVSRYANMLKRMGF